ncbi:MAG TPA: glutathione synthase, partial [Rhodopila sp.]|nr:glutathione synthase [Rhodopila sp.]
MARPLKVAVQMDPIESINIEGDSTFVLMLEAQARGHALWHYEVRHMSLKEGTARPGSGKRDDRLFARARPVKVARRHGAHYEFGPAEVLNLA